MYKQGKMNTVSNHKNADNCFSLYRKPNREIYAFTPLKSTKSRKATLALSKLFFLRKAWSCDH